MRRARTQRDVSFKHPRVDLNIRDDIHTLRNNNSIYAYNYMYHDSCEARDGDIESDFRARR